MNNLAIAALTIGVALAVPASSPGAFGHSLTLGDPHQRALHRHAGRGEGEKTLSVAPVVAAAPAWTPFQGSFVNPFATPPPPLKWPKIAPYPPGQGDTDGLSFDINDCNKGCIGGQPD